MIALLDISANLRRTACEEIGHEAGQLITPLTGYTNWGDAPFAIDNGAFTRFDEDEFRRILERERENRNRCWFVCAPDVVCDARRTLECFSEWYPKLNGWPRALVAQNGIQDLAIPWRLLDAVFIGGDDTFKDGPHAAAVIKAAQIHGKHTHVGRVNTPERWRRFESLGVDTCDGSGLCQYSHMRIAIRDRNKDQQAKLFQEVA